jgi:CheY-like chemotaxis protein
VITIVSPPPTLEKGTRVTVMLPLASPPTVLVADDAEGSRTRVAGLLTLHGYHLLDCRSQDEALDVARQERPDLVVLNFAMKGGMGGSFIALMKNEDTLHNLPILVLSDNEIDRVTHEILRGYKIPVIQEPWTDASFLDGVDDALLNSNTKRGAP